jgi:CDP-diacylglycerol--serine O-phosphatidyltransferase
MKNNHVISVPTLFTTLNLFCGFLSIELSASGHFVSAAWLIFIAGVFDALDGRIARAIGNSSEFGLQMDSLGDVISSGLAPAILVQRYYLYTLDHLGLILSFCPVLFAAFRLARFNVYTQKSGKTLDFIGMPAPMAAVTLSSIVILHDHTQWNVLLRLLVGLVPLVSLLMASGIRYDGFPHFSLRVKGRNRVKLAVFFLTLFLLLVFPEYVLFVFAMGYLLAGPFRAGISLLKNEDATIDILPPSDTEYSNGSQRETDESDGSSDSNQNT